VLHAQWPEVAGAEAERLIFVLARLITTIDVSTTLYVAALLGLWGEARREDLRPLPLALCDAAVNVGSGMRGDVTSPETLLEGAREVRELGEDGLVLILSAALLNKMNDACAQDDRTGGEALFGELRALSRAFPEDIAVREQLARGLLTSEIYAKAESDLVRRDSLFEELRSLAHNSPNDSAVRQQLAWGLSNTAIYVEAEDDFARRDALRDELQALAGTYPDDPAVQEVLARLKTV
jgi:hypothetical protein